MAIQRAGHHYGQGAFEKVLYIGDGVWDVRAAKALGIGFVGGLFWKRSQSCPFVT
jgi:phosphoglycolate phosphatase-like HAD superfamily hydrolase